MVAPTPDEERAELRRKIALTRAAREQALDELVQRLIHIDSLSVRLDVLLDRWNATEAKR